MKISPLKPKQHQKAAHIFWVLFPFLGFWLLWRFFKFLLNFKQFYKVEAPNQGQSKFLGLLAFTSFLLFKRKWFYLQYLAIDEKLQGKGLGSLALAQVEAKARGNKNDYFFLMSSPWRRNAQKFYFKQGFKRLLGFIFYKRLK